MYKSYRLYKVDDGFIGNCYDVAKHLNVKVPSVYEGVRLNRLVANHTITIAGKVSKVYGLYQGDRLIAKGSYKELGDKLFLAESTLRNAKNTKRKVLKKYTVKEVEDGSKSI